MPRIKRGGPKMRAATRAPRNATACIFKDYPALPMGADRLCEVVGGDVVARIIPAVKSNAGDSESTQVQIRSRSSAKPRSGATGLRFERGSPSPSARVSWLAPLRAWSCHTQLSALGGIGTFRVCRRRCPVSYL